MEYTPGFNIYHNAKFHLRRSQTLQPIRVAGLPDSKRYLLDKYFESQHTLKNNYANIPSSQEDLIEPLQTNLYLGQHNYLQHNHHSHNHNQSLHARSQSQHSYHTMRNDFNNYCNLSYNKITSNVKERSIVAPPDETTAPINNCQITPLEIMQVCNELQLGNLDSPPPLPNRRNYSVCPTERGLFKVTFSH